MQVVYKVLVLLDYEVVRWNTIDKCFFNSKSNTGVSFLTGALF